MDWYVDSDSDLGLRCFRFLPSVEVSWYLSPGASRTDLVTRPLELTETRGVLRPPTETPMPFFDTFRFTPGATLNDLRNTKPMMRPN